MTAGVSPAITVDFDSEVPVYRQIVEEIRTLVARRELRDGAPVPSLRQLGGQGGVNLNTVARAYRALADEGLVELRQGASARVRTPDVSCCLVVAPDDERRLDDLLSRWVLAGAGRAQIEEFFCSALDRFFGVRQGLVGNVDAAQHTRNFIDALTSIQWINRGHRGVAIGLFTDLIMMMSQRGHLR